MTDHRNIYRVRSTSPKKSGSWAVQVRHDAKVLSKSFLDKKFGGEAGSLDAAIAHRDHLMGTLGIASRLTKTGNPHPGVSRTESARTIKGKQGKGKRRFDAYWQAYWTDTNGKVSTRRFSINSLGEEGARRAAIEARDRAVKAISLKEDPFFEAPRNQNATLWRYMDLTKFMALLEDSAVFFSAAEEFDDPYEGALSQANSTSRSFVHSRVPQTMKQSPEQGL